MLWLLPLFLLTSPAFSTSPDVPYFLRDMKDEHDVGAINQNFRALTDYVRTLSTSASVTSWSGGSVSGSSTFTVQVAFQSTTTFSLNISSPVTTNALYANTIIKGYAYYATATGVIADSVNVSSVTVLGSFKTRVSWSTPFASANYAVSATGNREVATDAISCMIDAQRAASVDFICFNSAGNPADVPELSVIAVGRQ